MFLYTNLFLSPSYEAQPYTHTHKIKLHLKTQQAATTHIFSALSSEFFPIWSTSSESEKHAALRFQVHFKEPDGDDRHSCSGFLFSTEMSSWFLRFLLLYANSKHFPILPLKSGRTNCSSEEHKQNTTQGHLCFHTHYNYFKEHLSIISDVR